MKLRKVVGLMQTWRKLTTSVNQASKVKIMRFNHDQKATKRLLKDLHFSNLKPSRFAAGKDEKDLRIKMLPHTFFFLHYFLQELWNEWHLLYAVVRLNYHFRGLTNLVELDLSQNGLKEVPSGAVIDCKYLMRLSLRGNPGIRQVRSLTQFLSVCFLFKDNRLTSLRNLKD